MRCWAFGKKYKMDLLCLMLESLSHRNPVPGSASPIDPDLAFGVNLTCLFRVGVGKIGGMSTSFALRTNNTASCPMHGCSTHFLPMQGALLQLSQFLVDLCHVPSPQISLLSPFVEITRMIFRMCMSFTSNAPIFSIRFHS